MNSGAYIVAVALYKASGFAYEIPREAFRTIYGGNITFHRTGVTATNSGGGNRQR